jgi:hypothetical protein
VVGKYEGGHQGGKPEGEEPAHLTGFGPRVLAHVEDVFGVIKGDPADAENRKNDGGHKRRDEAGLEREVSRSELVVGQIAETRVDYKGERHVLRDDQDTFVF